MISVTPFIRAFHVSFTPSRDLDVVGYKIHAVAVTPELQLAGDFTPTEANQINDGPETSYLYTLPEGTPSGDWFVKVGAYDTFGVENMNYSSTIQVTVPQFQLLPDEMYAAGRTDFMVKDSIFNFGTYNNGVLENGSVLYYTAGSIVRGDKEYTFDSGSLTASISSYIIATLSGATATISSVTTAGAYPTLTADKVVLAITSESLSEPGKYLCYMRQANNLELEGAIIREATISGAKIKNATITNAKIGNAEVDTLKIAGNAVTITKSFSLIDVVAASSGSTVLGFISIDIPDTVSPSDSQGLIVTFFHRPQNAGGGNSSHTLEILKGSSTGAVISSGGVSIVNNAPGGTSTSICGFDANISSGVNTYYLVDTGDGNATISYTNISATIVLGLR